MEADFRPAHKALPTFVVEDLVGLTRRLAAAGHAMRIDEPPEGWTRVHVDGPFGNRLELMEPDNAATG